MQVLHLATLELDVNTKYYMEHNSKYPHAKHNTLKS